MTTRRFNYTGRQNILRSDVGVQLESEGEVHGFDADFDLARYSFPPTAEVVIEAYVGWTVMRFRYGTVGSPAEPPTKQLSEFSVPDGILFRLKVLGTGDQSGLILGEADRIRPSELDSSEPARSFLAVRPAELGAVVWRLSFDDSQPVLQLNEKLGDWRSFIRRPAVRAMLIPEIVRQLVREAVENEGDEGDASSWQWQVLNLAPAAAGAKPTGDDADERESWIDEVVSRFAQRHRLWRGMSDFIAEVA